MQKSRIYIIIFLLAYTGCVSADEECLKRAFTQKEMNNCAGLSYEAADKELNRVFNEIKVLYSDSPKFLLNLKASQLAWIKLRDADLELYYPEENKRVQYGSAYPMCASSRKTEITIQRIEFLKQWVKGIEEGDLCSGSIKNSWYLKPQNVTGNRWDRQPQENPKKNPDNSGLFTLGSFLLHEIQKNLSVSNLSAKLPAFI